MNVNFPPFADTQINKTTSEFYNWFLFKDEDCKNYETFNAIVNMPRLNLNNLAVQRYILKSMLYWATEIQVYGYRIDSTQLIPNYFISYLSNSLKQLLPDFIIITENWKSGFQEIYHTSIDSYMGYRFKNEILTMKEGDSLNFTKMPYFFGKGFSEYPTQLQARLLHFLDSHDTPRIANLLSGKQLFLAWFLLFSLPGVPVIYNGSEIGMKGDKDPFNRKGFEWNNIDSNEVLTFVRVLTKFRKGSLPIQKGEFKLLSLLPHSLSFERIYQNEMARIEINDNFQGVKSFVNDSNDNSIILSIEDIHFKITHYLEQS